MTFWKPWKTSILSKETAPSSFLQSRGKGLRFYYKIHTVSPHLYSLSAVRENSLVFVGLSRTAEGLRDVLVDARLRPAWRESEWEVLQSEFPTLSAVELWGTPFQCRVWKELLALSEDQIVTYQFIAEKLGNPRACRAVGSAVGANPIAGLIPCHRIVPTNGGLGSYRWGAAIKEMLLREEGGTTRETVPTLSKRLAFH